MLPFITINILSNNVAPGILVISELINKPRQLDQVFFRALRLLKPILTRDTVFKLTNVTSVKKI